MILAQLPAPDSYQAIGWICVAAAAVAMGANSILKLVDRARGKPQQPPNKQLETIQKDLQRRVEIAEAAISGIRSEMKVESDKVAKSSEELRTELTGAIEKVRESSMDAHEKTRDQMDVGFRDVERALGRLEGKLSQ